MEVGNIVPQQAGFRQCYSKEDQTAYLSQGIEGVLDDKNLLLVAWVCLIEAIDKVWKEGLMK